MSLPFFDGHNDVLLRLLRAGASGGAARFVDGTPDTQLDLPRARRAGFAGGLFAMFAPSPEHYDFEDFQSDKGYSVPMPPPLAPELAQDATLKMVGVAEEIETMSSGGVRICRQSEEIRDCIDRGQLAMVLHIEGADCIDAEFRFLDVLYVRGLRSIGLVWSRDNIFGHGVPFQFPAPPDMGGGLTEQGKALVSECDLRGIMIDLSHLNEKGFWDVAGLSSRPLIATHSNAHRLCASPRNLTDRQLRAIADTGGVVGVNFAPCFLAANGLLESAVPLEQVLAHIRYLANHLGEDGVTLGSDFDGVMMPDEIGDVLGVPKIFAALEKGGWSSRSIEKFALGNWMRVLRQTIG